MTDHRRTPRQSCVIVVLVALLVAITGFTLFHSHKDWTDQGCQLCHVRHLPSLATAIPFAYDKPVVCEQNWDFELAAEELDTCIRNTSSRAPPAPSTFTF